MRPKYTCALNTHHYIHPLYMIGTIFGMRRKNCSSTVDISRYYIYIYIIMVNLIYYYGLILFLDRHIKVRKREKKRHSYCVLCAVCCVPCAVCCLLTQTSLSSSPSSPSTIGIKRYKPFYHIKVRVGDLVPGQNYCFRVAGINDVGEGPFSGGADAVTAIAPPATPEPPATDEVRETILIYETR